MKGTCHPGPFGLYPCFALGDKPWPRADLYPLFGSFCWPASSNNPPKQGYRADVFAHDTKSGVEAKESLKIGVTGHPGQFDKY